jgi:activator of HSP90 ATPase
MNNIANPSTPIDKQSRRKLVAGLVFGLGALAANTKSSAEPQQLPMKETTGTAANSKVTSLHYQATFKAGPQSVYEALLDPKQFAAFTGVPAEIDAKEGGAFSLFGGQILGRNVELIPNQRIVQAWRPASWDPGVYSIVKFELKPSGPGSTLVLDHTGFPEGLADHLNSGWHTHYLDTLQRFFA